MKWQPMPACAREPSGTFVDMLCGQPAQKYGRRLTASPAFESSAGSVKSTTWWRRSSSGKRVASQSATISISRDGRTLVLDDEDLGQARGEGLDARRLERIREAHLVEPHARRGERLYKVGLS